MACDKPGSFVTEYRSDPAEEAYYASPEGLRNEARNRRAWAARLIKEAEEMEARANVE